MNTLFAMETANFKPLDGSCYLLTFIYFLAHQTGIWIIKLVQSIFPRVVFLDNAVDPSAT